MTRVARLRERWHLARSILRYGGAGPFIGIVARGILRPIVACRAFCFFERDLSEPVAAVDSAIPLEIRIATDVDFERFHDVLLRESGDESDIEQRRASGALCFLGLAGERLVQCTWLARRAIWLPALGVTLELGADETYVPFTYTDPAVRGQGVHPAVINFILRWERSAGVRYHHSFVMGHNVSAMKVNFDRRAGTAASRGRTVRTVRLLGVRGFLAVGLLGAQRPRLKPGRHVDWGRFGLWMKP